MAVVLLSVVVATAAPLMDTRRNTKISMAMEVAVMGAVASMEADMEAVTVAWMIMTGRSRGAVRYRVRGLVGVVAAGRIRRGVVDRVLLISC